MVRNALRMDTDMCLQMTIFFELFIACMDPDIYLQTITLRELCTTQFYTFVVFPSVDTDMFLQTTIV